MRLVSRGVAPRESFSTSITRYGCILYAGAYTLYGTWGNDRKHTADLAQFEQLFYTLVDPSFCTEPVKRQCPLVTVIEATITLSVHTSTEARLIRIRIATKI